MSLDGIPVDGKHHFNTKENKAFRSWERVSDQTWRLKVLGGWLVRYDPCTMVFLPDAKHEWQWIIDADGITKLREKK